MEVSSFGITLAMYGTYGNAWVAEDGTLRPLAVAVASIIQRRSTSACMHTV
jgi:hypothetical protein